MGEKHSAGLQGISWDDMKLIHLTHDSNQVAALCLFSAKVLYCVPSSLSSLLYAFYIFIFSCYSHLLLCCPFYPICYHNSSPFSIPFYERDLFKKILFKICCYGKTKLKMSYVISMCSSSSRCSVSTSN